MRILFLTTSLTTFGLGLGGDPWMDFLIEMSKHANVTVIAPRVGAQVETESERLRIIRIDPSRPRTSLEDAITGLGGIRIPATLFNMWRAARSLTSKESFNVVHSLWVIPSGLIGAYLPAHYPKVISCLGSDIHTWSRRPLVRDVVRHTLHRTKLCICVSRALISRVVELGAREAIWIPTPVDTLRFPLSLSHADSHGVAFVGRLTRKKGVFELVQAAKLVIPSFPDFRMYMCGEGPERSRLERYVESLGLQNNVLFKGILDHEHLRETLACVKGVILPSAAEGMPSSVLEAMSTGRPVVATGVGDLPALLNSESGILLDSSEPEEIARGIIKVVESKYDAKRIRRRVLDFDTHRIVARYLDAYSNIC